VIAPVAQKKGAVEGFVDDTVIDTKINGLLLDGKGVNVTNFRWRSVQGHVFLFGRAFSGAEKTKAVGIVKGIEGVQSVTDHVKVRAKK
jgi:hyperosmotically inducible protein